MPEIEEDDNTDLDDDITLVANAIQLESKDLTTNKGVYSSRIDILKAKSDVSRTLSKLRFMLWNTTW